ncbi:MAG: hypothetical protein MJ180_01535 [Candidatus Gastranaerophilales bacterium]|nr:hypothetical protein [Candidatus Gastranaerophilales bacterium]
MTASLSALLAVAKNDILPPPKSEQTLIEHENTNDKDTMVIFEPFKMPDELSKIAEKYKKEAKKEEKAEKKESVWSKFGKFVANNIDTIAFGAVSAVLLCASTPAILAVGAVSSLTILAFGSGLLSGGLAIGCGLHNYFSRKDDKKYQTEMKKLTEEKLHEKSTKALDKSTVNKVKGTMSKKEFVSFKINGGALTQNLHMPMALEANKILEKYSTEDSPEISENEQTEFNKDIDKFFIQLKEKANNSIVQKEYSFGQYNIPATLTEFKSIEDKIRKLISQTTDEKSSGGKSIDKNELTTLRQQIFLSLNN